MGAHQIQRRSGVGARPPLLERERPDLFFFILMRNEIHIKTLEILNKIGKTIRDCSEKKWKIVLSKTIKN
jgi:hypothetical protein